MIGGGALWNADTRLSGTHRAGKITGTGHIAGWVEGLGD